MVFSDIHLWWSEKGKYKLFVDKFVTKLLNVSLQLEIKISLHPLKNSFRTPSCLQVLFLGTIALELLFLCCFQSNPSSSFVAWAQGIQIKALQKTVSASDIRCRNAV